MYNRRRDVLMFFVSTAKRLGPRMRTMISRCTIHNQIAAISTEALYLLILKIIGALSLFSDEAIGRLLSWSYLQKKNHLTSASVVATHEPFPGNIFCAVQSHRCTLYAYVGILVVETMFLGMALRKAWMHRQSQSGSQLMRELSRDSVFYFFM